MKAPSVPASRIASRSYHSSSLGSRYCERREAIHGPPEATIPPPLPATIGLTQVITSLLKTRPTLRIGDADCVVYQVVSASVATTITSSPCPRAIDECDDTVLVV